MEIRRVLYPVDFSETTVAGLSTARSLATEHGAELILLHVLNFPYQQLDRITPSFDLEGYYRDMESEACASLEALVAPETREFAPTSVRVARGAPAAEILDLAEQESVDLIVIPTHGRTGFQHLLFGSTAEKVVRLARCPVLTVRPSDTPAAFRPRRILVASDFSPSAEHAYREAVGLARRYGARLTLVHVVTMWDSDPANPAWRFPSVPTEFHDTLMETARARLHDRAQQDELQIDTYLCRGFDPAREIVRAASERDRADLIVMGTHGHTGLTHALLGSVAEKVVRTFDGQVLTIRLND
jgi:nucleotide-binding universal stress UspA family protein